MEEICHVCGKPLDEIYAVSCMGCGRRIHFPPEESAKETCATIVTQSYACSLGFVCKQCSAQQPVRDLKASG